MTSISLGASSTISVWFNLTGSSNTSEILGRAATQSDLIDVNNTNDEVRFYVNNNLEANFRWDSISFSADTWFHLVITRGAVASECKAYVNGVEADTTSYASPQTITTNSVPFDRIGSSLYPSNMYGKLNEIAIWDSVTATQTNVTDLYNSGNGALASDIIASPNRYYRLNSYSTSTTATDDGTDGADGTLNNFPTSGMWVTH